MPHLVLDVQITADAWRRVPRLRARLQSAARAVAGHLPPALLVSAEATLLLAGNAKVRQLNLDFRGIDRATNVLSFPQFSPSELRRLKKQRNAVFLGDIVLGYSYIADEAKKDEKSLIGHATHLAVHGLLHLFGYDHADAAAARRMEIMEIKIMKSLGLPSPYAPLSTARKNRKAKTAGKKKNRMDAKALSKN
jgi:probable rRNA maturation factor